MAADAADAALEAAIARVINESCESFGEKIAAGAGENGGAGGRVVLLSVGSRYSESGSVVQRAEVGDEFLEAIASRRLAAPRSSRAVRASRCASADAVRACGKGITIHVNRCNFSLH